ncbi:uncharacterized protein LOC107044744 [Diachasma alloeum]|uniref:uncharacterized protein LOC107044744 n=1 Tax=Diachasma alloeum TaxID=454923 RepID=UPI0007383E25|nr:uncharacterized protein LOC107044744 [Diachasma alloeum]
MEEYISLGHMTLCDEIEDGYYLPHHAVIKESSETTKVRVVFDASAKTSTGISLNDTLLVGPTIQNTIFEQVLRFRTHRYVITADIEKMYRQILIHLDDRQFQRVLWPYQGKLRTFQLNTVTFGTAAAPFLAIRTIQQLARDEAQNFPRASKLLLRDFYVDDFISGADSLDELITIRDDMIALLSRGGFVIRQWSSNHRSALDKIDKSFFDLDCLIKDDPVQKTLGIIWDAQGDLLQYTLTQVDPNVVATKLLSEVSKIFDLLGLLGPVTLFAKVLIQDCWKAKITWDEPLPQDIHTKWTSLVLQLPKIREVSVPRQILIQNPSRIESHGFSDASSHGYGACLYLKSSNPQGPRWLILGEPEWSQFIVPSAVLVQGLKRNLCLITTTSCDSLYSQFSDFKRFVRVGAYIRRWKYPQTPWTRPLTNKELYEAEHQIVMMVQRERFSVEVRRLTTNQSSTNSTRSSAKGTSFDQLHPFVDDKGLLRVGGRLKKSELSYNQKRPILLPSKHPVTDMIIHRAHH